MSEATDTSGQVVRISVRLQVGDSRMAASDDPLFLGLGGPAGREFRLDLAKGRSRRRGAEDVYVLGAPDDPETNVSHAELNDPTSPAIDADLVTGVYLRKDSEPIPNVRGVGEMDDRIEIGSVEVEIQAEGRPKAIRFQRGGPIWLGLVCGLRLELAGVDEAR
jgi:hypothetical protein